MRRVRWFVAPLAAAAVLFLSRAAAPTQEKSAAAVDLRVVKYDGLAQEVLKHRGKVVVLDFWQFT